MDGSSWQHLIWLISLKGISGKTGRYDEPFDVIQWEFIAPSTRYPLKDIEYEFNQAFRCKY